jgi:hypothetical protein
MPAEEEYAQEPELSAAQAFTRGSQVMAQLQSVSSGYLRATMPDGEQDILMYPGYAKDPEHLWIMGNHPEFTTDQLTRLQEALVKRKECFAYQLSDLQG